MWNRLYSEFALAACVFEPRGKILVGVGKSRPR